MTPLTDAMVIPGLATALMSIDPTTLGVLAAVVAGAAWLVRGMTEELRRAAAREWDARVEPTRADVSDRMAA